jgi:hypothetical protein
MKLHYWNGLSPLGHRPSRPWQPSPRPRQGNHQGAWRRHQFWWAAARWGGVVGWRDGRWGRGPDLVTGEEGGSPEGGFHGGTEWAEGNGSEGWRPVVEVGGSWFGKVVGTRAVVGVALTECVCVRRWLGGGRWWQARHRWQKSGRGRDGARRSRSGRELHCNHAQRDMGAQAAHMADVHGDARAIGTWPSSCHVRGASDRVPFKWRLRLTSGPWPFFDFF